MRQLFFAIVLATSLLIAWQRPPKILGPYSSSVNYPADLTGVPDTRPGTWGLGAAQTDVIQFHPPAGYRVRVLRVYGNFMAWPRAVYAPGNHTGVSWGLTTSDPVGSPEVDAAADGCFVYEQYALGNSEVNQSFDFDTSTGGLLGADNVMNEVSAVFLNDQPIPVHSEVTFVIVYRFEPAAE